MKNIYVRDIDVNVLPSGSGEPVIHALAAGFVLGTIIGAAAR